MTRQSFEDGNKNNSIFLNLLESRFPVRDFQEINYPSCGVGVPARPVYRTGKMPIPQEKVEYFFIWKSLSKIFPHLYPKNFLLLFETIAN
jgi:hypothetical protein